MRKRTIGDRFLVHQYRKGGGGSGGSGKGGSGGGASADYQVPTTQQEFNDVAYRIAQDGDGVVTPDQLMNLGVSREDVGRLMRNAYDDPRFTPTRNHDDIYPRGFSAGEIIRLRENAIALGLDSKVNPGEPILGLKTRSETGKGNPPLFDRNKAVEPIAPTRGNAAAADRAQSTLDRARARLRNRER